LDAGADGAATADGAASVSTGFTTTGAGAALVVTITAAWTDVEAGGGGAMVVDGTGGSGVELVELVELVDGVGAGA